MSESRVTEFSTAPIEPQEVDLLARLYHEIGLSAVAAALEILGSSSESSLAATSAFESRFIPAPHEESLAA